MIALRSFCIATLVTAGCALFGTTAHASPKPAQKAAVANPTPGQLDQGKQTFESTCSTCHGLDGGGAMGPNIQGIPFRLGTDAVTNIIKNGISNGGMPAFGATLSAAQIQSVVDYLLSLTRKDAGPVTGDPTKGRQLYASNGCANCHMIDGEGGDNGPELSKVGSERGPNYLRTTLLYPGEDLPQAQVFLESGGKLDFLYVEAVTKDGNTVDGTRVAEDSFHIVLKDASGKFHSFKKEDLRELRKEPGKSLMPSFKGKLSGADLNDLVAYLASLKGAQ